jgi:hypothetical protein
MEFKKSTVKYRTLLKILKKKHRKINKSPNLPKKQLQPQQKNQRRLNQVRRMKILMMMKRIQKKF